MSRNEAIRAAVAAGARMTDVAREYQISRQRAEQIVHAQEAKARRRVADALESGELIRPSACQGCGRTYTRSRIGNRSRIESHHNDYSRPLDVRWLCRQCHRVADTERRGPQVAARRAARMQRRAELRSARLCERRARSRSIRHARGEHALAVLVSFVRDHRRSPSYHEPASLILGRPVAVQGACVALAGWLDSRRLPRRWLRVRALYRLAGVEPRARGEPGHVPPRKNPGR